MTAFWIRSNANAGKVIIELAGAAGSGKSFLMQKLQDSIEGKIYKPRPNFMDYLFLLLVLPTLVFIRRDHCRLWRLVSRRVLLFRALARETNGIYVVDEGPWHFYCGSYCSRTWKFAERALFYACMPVLNFKLMNHILFLSVSPDTVKSRRISRARHNEKSYDRSKIIRSCQRRDRLMRFLERKYFGNVTLRVFENNSDGDWKSILEHVRTLAALASPRAPQIQFEPHKFAFDP